MRMDFEPAVKGFFESLGYQAEKIEESSKEEPDFLVYDDRWSYLVELKTKFPNAEELKDRVSTLSAGKIHQVIEPVTRSNRLSAIVRKAQSQLSEKIEYKESFKILWFLATGFKAEAMVERAESTLYGSASIVEFSDRGGMRTCYFFGNSDFHRFRDSLDGAIVSTETNARMLLNPLSSRFKDLASSSLCRHLKKGVVNPVELERRKLAFLVEGDVDRSNEEVVLGYLRGKYRLDKIMKMTLSHMSGTLSMPSNS